MNKTVLAAIAAGTAAASIALAAWPSKPPVEDSCCAPDAPAQFVSFAAARCTGSAFCRACSNCSSCAHCKSGGSCGACSRPVVPAMPKPAPVVPRPDPAPKATPEPKSTTPAPKPEPRPKPAPDPTREARSKLNMGAGMERMERLREAALYYRQALDLDPQGEHGKEARKSLTRITGQVIGPDAVVTKIIDGYTIEARTGDGKPFEVRFLGIDPPPAANPEHSNPAFTRKAADLTETTLLRQPVWLAFDHLGESKDDQGRTIAYVYRKKDGLSFNRHLIARGYARVAGTPFGARASFLEAERQARRERLGIWGLDFVPGPKSRDSP